MVPTFIRSIDNQRGLEYELCFPFYLKKRVKSDTIRIWKNVELEFVELLSVTLEW